MPASIVIKNGKAVIAFETTEEARGWIKERGDSVLYTIDTVPFGKEAKPINQ